MIRRALHVERRCCRWDIPVELALLVAIVIGLADAPAAHRELAPGGVAS